MPRKGENIYKRKDGRWEGRYAKSKSSSGKTNYGYVYGKTYREAKAKLIAALTNCDKIDKLISENTTSFDTIAWKWYESNVATVKVSTSNKYRNLLTKYILPVFGDMSLSSVTCNFIEDQCKIYLNSCGSKGQGLSPKTVADILSVIRNILRYADNHGIVVSSNLSNIRIKQNSKAMRVLSKQEQEKLCRYLRSDLNPHNIGILICLFTGLRVGEICALRWEDISLSERTLYIHQTMQRVQRQSSSGPRTSVIITSPKSSCSVRTIPLPNDLVEIITAYKSSSVGYFLTNSTQKFIEPRTMQNRFKKVLRACDIAPANFHSLRHTFATRCVELGFDVKSLSELLGHASVNITMNRYVHPSMDLKKENMERLFNLLTVK